MVLRFLTGAILLASQLSHANVQANSDVSKFSLEILGERYKIQKYLEAANEEFDMLFRDTKDLEVQERYLRLTAKTQAEKTQKFALTGALKKMRGFEDKEKTLIRSLGEILNLESNTDGRLLSVGVSPNIPLYNGYSISKTSDDNLKSPIGDLGTGVREICFIKEGQPTDPKELFLSFNIKSLGCANEPNEARLLTDPFDSFSQKIELLTGTPMAKETIEKADPKHQLDMSKAPRLDSIILSYLEYKNDFSGHMIAQALKYHASHGTQVRISLPGLLVPDSLSLVTPKDKKLLAELTSFSKNIQVDMYRFLESNPDLTTPLNILGRSYHAKILAVLSKQDPLANAVIVGGRNIKDTFYMQKMPDYSKFPELTQYGPTGEKFAFYRDLEVLIRGRTMAETVASQVMSLWRRDRAGPRVLKTSANIAALVTTPDTLAALKSKISSKTFARHFFAVPYVDDKSTEAIYAQMFAQAKTKIRILNPYVRPTKTISNALRDALVRGVDIDLVANFDFALDNTAGFVGDMNKMSMNSLLKNAKGKSGKVRIFNWNETPFSIMHSKAIMIDEDLLYVGSGNMNNRTFTHDIENGMIMTGPITQQFKELYDGFYIPNSKEITEKQQTNFFWGILIRFLDALKMT